TSSRRRGSCAASAARGRSATRRSPSPPTSAPWPPTTPLRSSGETDGPCPAAADENFPALLGCLPPRRADDPALQGLRRAPVLSRAHVPRLRQPRHRLGQRERSRHDLFAVGARAG